MTTANVALYITHLFNMKLAPRTISTYLSALSYLHKIQGFADPTKEFLIQKLVAGAYKLRPAVDMRLPITKPILNKIVAAAQHVMTGQNRIIFSALFAFAFHTYSRIGELVYSNPTGSQNVIQLQDVSIITKNKYPVEVKVCFKKFKHNISGQPHLISFKATPDTGCPVKLFITYLQTRGTKPGNLFCNTLGQPITRRCFDSQLRLCLDFCKLSNQYYKGHSFRIGAASWDAENGVPDSQIRLKGRWKSDAFRKYIRVCTN